VQPGPSGVTTLERPVPFRLWFGSRLQALATTFAVVVVIVLVARAAGSGGKHGLTAVQGLILLLVLLVAVAIGATGHAEFDASGVRWRYYAARSFGWNEIERVELARYVIGITARVLAIDVYVGGRRHRVTPATNGGAGRDRFGRALAATAAARGIEVVDNWP
jgi:hypothetical protein